jgi:hypothetical protein
MDTLPDLNNLPDDLGELGTLFDAARRRCQELADKLPAAYSVVDGKVVLAFPSQEQLDELNAARAVCREIAVKMSRIRLEAKAPV